MFKNLNKKFAKVALVVMAMQLSLMGIGTGATLAYADDDVNPPTVIALTHNEAAKTITYTFSEPVRLTSNDGAIVYTASEYADKLGIYAFDDVTMSYGPTEAIGTDVVSTTMVGNVMTIGYTGSLVKAVVSKYVVDAWGSRIADMAGNKMVADQATQVFTVASDVTAPTSTVVHDEVAKTITYTFSEPVKLTSNDGAIVYTASEYADKLAIYEVMGLDYTTLTKVEASPITVATLNPAKTKLVLTYTGSLVKSIDAKYVVDAWGYRITDELNNKMVSDASQMFTVLGTLSRVVPATVTDLVSSVDADGHVTLTWTNPPAGTFTSIRVYREGDFYIDLPATSTRYTDMSTERGVTYNYVVRTINSVGNFANTSQLPVTVPAATPVVATAFTDSSNTWAADYVAPETNTNNEEVKAQTAETDEPIEEKKDGFPTWGIIMLLILAAVGGYLIWNQNPAPAPVVGKTKTGTTTKKK